MLALGRSLSPALALCSSGAPCSTSSGLPRPRSPRGARLVKLRPSRPVASLGALPRADDEITSMPSIDEDSDKLEELKIEFRAADTRGEGKLDVSQVRALLNCNKAFCFSQQVMTEEETLDVLLRYDRDGDLCLDFDEFIDFALDKLFLEERLQVYESAFKKADASGDGRLQRAELREMLTSLGTSQERADEIFDRYIGASHPDVGDPSREGLSFEEFIVLARNTVQDIGEIVRYVEQAPPSKPASLSPKQGAKEEGKGAGGLLGKLFGAMPEAVSAKKWRRGHVNEISSMEEFQDILNTEKGLVILEVGFTFCKACKKIEKKLPLFAEHYKDALFVKVYGNKNESTKMLCKQVLHLRATPSFFMYCGGEFLDKHSGAKEDPLRTKIIAALKTCQEKGA